MADLNTENLDRQAERLNDVEALLRAIDASCADGRPPDELVVNRLARIAAAIVSEVREEIDAICVAHAAPRGPAGAAP